jgi:hypothetical protein
LFPYFLGGPIGLGYRIIRHESSHFDDSICLTPQACQDQRVAIHDRFLLILGSAAQQELIQAPAACLALMNRAMPAVIALFSFQYWYAVENELVPFRGAWLWCSTVITVTQSHCVFFLTTSVMSLSCCACSAARE